jgi:hypothetical protein
MAWRQITDLAKDIFGALKSNTGGESGAAQKFFNYCDRETVSFYRKIRTKVAVYLSSTLINKGKISNILIFIYSCFEFVNLRHCSVSKLPCACR